MRWWSVVGWMVVGVLAGCAQVPRQTSLMARVPGVHMSTAELRERVLELGRRQVALVEEGVASAGEAFTDAETRRSMLTWGLAAVPDVQEASLNSDPLVSLADLWALSFQTQAFAYDGPGHEHLGPAHVYVERVGQKMQHESEELARLVFGEADLPRRRQQVQRWAAANPIEASTFSRPTASAVLAREMDGGPQGPMGFIASTEERLALLDARLEMMNKTLLGRIRWTSQLLIKDTLGTENISMLTEDLQAFVDQQRERATRDLEHERVEIFAQVARERNAIFEQVASERAAITAEVNRLLAQANADAHRLVDRTLIRVGIGALVLLALAALAAWIVWHGSRGPRRRVSSRPWPKPAHGSTLP